MTPRFVEANGQRFAVFERPGTGRQAFFAHATGFHARSWNEILRRLPSDVHYYAVDLRGHGLSSKPEPPYSWRWFGEDVAALAPVLGLKHAVGVGHSMGAHSLALASVLAPDAFEDLVLIDPVIMPESYYTGTRAPHYARKRRNRWPSPEAMFESFKQRPPFQDWDMAMLRDYCQWALLPDGDEYVMACPPDVEGSIYENSGAPDANLYGVLGDVRANVTVVRSIRGRMTNDGPVNMGASPCAPDLASRFAKGREIPVEYSHFVPMEAPQFVAQVIADSL